MAHHSVLRHGLLLRRLCNWIGLVLMTWPRSPLPKPKPYWQPERPKTKRGPSRDRTLPGKARIRARRAAKKEES